MVIIILLITDKIKTNNIIMIIEHTVLNFEF